MKRTILILICLAGVLAPPLFADDNADREMTAFRQRGFRLQFAAYADRRACFLFGYPVPYPIQQPAPAAPAQPDPLLLAMVQRIADQQASLATQMMLLNQQSQQNNRPMTTDPQVVALLSQLAAKQDVLVEAIREGKIADSATQALLREMITGQNALLVAIREQKSTPCPPVIVTPPTNPPPIVVTPTPGGGTLPGAGGTQPLPGAGGPLQVLPGPGGSLQVIPPAGGTLQAIPGPGGSIQLLPGVKPPDGTKPPAGGGTQPLPGGGIIIPIPDPGPMQPLPGAGDKPGVIPVQKPLKPYRYAIWYPPR